MEDGKKCERLAREIFDMFRVGTNASLISKAQRVLTSGHAMSYALFYHPEGMTASELAEIGDCDYLLIHYHKQSFKSHCKAE